MNRQETLRWLHEQDPQALEELWRRADATRRRTVGEAVHLRGLVEVSNHCVRQCAYCGIRAGRTSLPRYRMTSEEVVICARLARRLGYGTLVLQAGEDPGLSRDWVSEVIRCVQGETALAVTLSLGERPEGDLAAWREAGADRYLLRFETSDRALLDRIHPPRCGRPADRVVLLRRLQELGYETGSGMMVGIPGQTYDSLADDLELIGELDLDMIGLGPYVAHPETPLGASPEAHLLPTGRQVPNTDAMTYKCLALARLICPAANIPSTTALALLAGGAGRQLGLQRGANIVMPNLTPLIYRRCYEIYPAKGKVEEATEEGDRLIRESLAGIGRAVGVGPGTSPAYSRRGGSTAAHTRRVGER